MGKIWIGQLINCIKQNSDIDPITRQVIINRLESKPTREELDKAYKEVYGAVQSRTEKPVLRDQGSINP